MYNVSASLYRGYFKHFCAKADIIHNCEMRILSLDVCVSRLLKLSPFGCKSLHSHIIFALTEKYKHHGIPEPFWLHKTFRPVKVNDVEKMTKSKLQTIYHPLLSQPHKAPSRGILLSTLFFMNLLGCNERMIWLKGK